MFFCRGLNEKFFIMIMKIFLKKGEIEFEIKKLLRGLEEGQTNSPSTVQTELKLRYKSPSAHTLRWRFVRRVRFALEPVLPPQGWGRETLEEGGWNGHHS